MTALNKNTSGTEGKNLSVADKTFPASTNGAGTGGRMTARLVAEQALTACLPPGVPPSFTIRSARYQGAGRSRQIIAECEMVDGLPATVVLTRWHLGWSHCWTRMPGGPLSWERGQWVRRPEDLTPTDALTTGAGA